MSDMNMHQHVLELLLDRPLTGASLGEAMILAIDSQLELQAKRDLTYLATIDKKDEDIVLPITIPEGKDDEDDEDDEDDSEDVPSPTSSDHQPTALFDHAAVRVAIELGKASDDEVCVRLPYAILSQALRIASRAAAAQSTAQSKSKNSNLRTDDIDEWVLRSEAYIRARLVLDQQSPASPASEEEASPLSQLGIDRSASHWEEFIVGLGRDAKSVFSSGSDTMGSSTSTIRIERPDKADLPGLLVLDHHRKDAIQINTLSAFHLRFDSMTFGALKGLDWRNVLVAGEISMGALTSVTDEDAKQSESSDIDLYLWGITVDQANAKLQDIEKVFVSNLPLDKDTGKPIKHAVLRTLTNITFLAERFPYRRVSIDLKIFSNPMAILMEFDLDQDAIGYTGDEVWMLPRASRALVTGYSTFTMDLVHESFIDPRKATQDQKVFKYGERGYGLRFHPSYIETLPTVPLNEKTTTEKNVPEESLPRDELNVTLREERARVAWWLASHNWKFQLPLQERRISMDHCQTRSFGQPKDSGSLSRWQLLARHVALWELAQLNYFVLYGQKENRVSDLHPNNLLAFDDGPMFSWDEGFKLDDLRHSVDAANLFADCLLEGYLSELGIMPSRHDEDDEDFDPREDHDELAQANAEKFLNKRIPLKGVILASSLRDALAEPLAAIVHMPKNLRAHAEVLLEGAVSSFEDVIKADVPLPLPAGQQHDAEEDARVSSNAESVLSYWINGPNPNTRQTAAEGAGNDLPIVPHRKLVSRETDEAYEIMLDLRSALRKANLDDRGHWTRKAQAVIIHRLRQPTEREERDSFQFWACWRFETSFLRPVVGSSEGILQVPRWVVFRRFTLTEADSLHIGDELYQADRGEEEVDWDEEDSDEEAGESMDDSDSSVSGTQSAESKKLEPATPDEIILGVPAYGYVQASTSTTLPQRRDTPLDTQPRDLRPRHARFRPRYNATTDEADSNQPAGAPVYASSRRTLQVKRQTSSAEGQINFAALLQQGILTFSATEGSYVAGLGAYDGAWAGVGAVTSCTSSFTSLRRTAGRKTVFIFIKSSLSWHSCTFLFASLTTF
ncbi:unnamed protein product [Tilletia controversa]|nr:unnamed protein product [Tilletia controversa]